MVGQHLDGRLDVFGTDGSDNSIWHNMQSAPSGGWVGWQPFMAGDKAARLAVGRNQDGRLEVFASATDNSLWRIRQAFVNHW